MKTKKVQSKKFRHRKTLRQRRKTKKIMKGGEGEYLLLCADFPKCKEPDDIGDENPDYINTIIKSNKKVAIAVSDNNNIIIGKLTDKKDKPNKYIVKNKENKTVGYFILREKNNKYISVEDDKRRMKKIDNIKKKANLASARSASASARSASASARSASAVRSLLPSAKTGLSAQRVVSAQKELDEMFSRLNPT